MGTEAHRQAFADFLDRIARGGDGRDEWCRLVVAHYFDEQLEEIRCRLARLSIERDPGGSPAWQDSDREQLRTWAGLLRETSAA